MTFGLGFFGGQTSADAFPVIPHELCEVTLFSKQCWEVFRRAARGRSELMERENSVFFFFYFLELMGASEQSLCSTAQLFFLELKEFIWKRLEFCFVFVFLHSQSFDFDCEKLSSTGCIGVGSHFDRPARSTALNHLLYEFYI